MFGQSPEKAMIPDGVSVRKLRKIKRPGGVFVYDVQPVVEDGFGVWLYAARGSNWEAPHDQGTLPCDVLLLLSPERHWVAWWVDDPDDKRLEIDVCLAPERKHDGWSYVDLELDPIRHEGGMIEIEDTDEFDDACRSGWIRPEDARMAHETALAMETALRNHEEPLGDEGWRRLADLHGSRKPTI
jgi:hypothetical protein